MVVEATHEPRRLRAGAVTASRLLRRRADQPVICPCGGGPLSPSELLTLFYRSILGRAPDDTGLADYLKGIEAGMSLEDVVRSIAGSEEAAMIRLRTVREALWRARTSRPARPVFFLHIMKTGGTALASALRRLAGPERCMTGLFLDHLVGVPEYVLEAMAVIGGHLPYEALELLPDDVAVCTVLREPVDRTLSYYCHLQRDPAFSMQNPGFSLEQFVESPDWAHSWSNHQARQLVHQVGVARAWDEFSPRARLDAFGIACPSDFPHPLQLLFDCTPMALADAELERRALDRVESIELLGVTDRLDALLAEVAAFLGEAPAPVLHRENDAPTRLHIDDVPGRFLERIRDGNQVDAALYERARRLAAR